MLTMEQTFRDQKNLTELCVDRPLNTTEPFSPNAFYGLNKIMKLYAGLEQNTSLKVVLPHGVSLRPEFVWDAEKNVRLPVIWCYPEYKLDSYRKKTNKEVIPSASPFVYLIELLKQEPAPIRKGTLFFPSHSTHYVTVVANYAALAEAMVALDEIYQPVTICMYWRDYNLGGHRPFEERGLRVVSAGHMYDEDFLFRLYHLLSTHQYASGNKTGSHLFYAVKAGCSYFHLSGHDISEIDSHKEQREALEKAPVSDRIEQEIENMFAMPSPVMTASQIELVDRFLGSKYLLTPEKAREVLLSAEKADRHRFMLRENGKIRYFMFPTFYPRKARHLARWVYRKVQRYSR